MLRMLLASLLGVTCLLNLQTSFAVAQVPADMKLTTERIQANTLLMQSQPAAAFKILLRHHAEAKTRYDKGLAELHLAGGYLYISDHRNAVRFYREGLGKVDATNYAKRLRKGPWSYPYARFIVDRGYQKLGYCCWKIGKLNAARKALTQALKIVQDHGKDDPKNRVYSRGVMIRVLDNLDNVERDAGNIKASLALADRWLKYVDDSFADLKKGKPVVYGAGAELTLNFVRAKALIAANRNVEALAAIRQCHEVCKNGSKEYWKTTQIEVFHHALEVEILKKLGRQQEALAAAKVALEIAKDRRVPGHQPVAYAKAKQWLVPTAAFMVGDLSAINGDPAAAEKAFRQAVNALEELYKSAGSSQMRMRLADRGGVFGPEPAYLRLAEVLAGRGKWKEAFAIAEKGRSRALVDSLGNSTVRETGAAALSAAEIAQERIILQKMKQIKQTLMVARFNPRLDSRSLKSRLRSAHEEYSAFRERLALRHPGYAVFHNVQTINAAGLKQLYKNRKHMQSTATISFVQAGRSLLGFCFDGEKLHGRVLRKGGIEKTRDLVARLRDQVTQKSSRWSSAAKELEELLLRPFYPQIENKRQLLLVPHGVLHQVPFAILCDGLDRPLIHRHRVTVIPTVSILKVWGKQPVDSQSLANGNVLAVINPDGSLPHTEKESTTLLRLFQNIQLLAGNKATESRFMSLVSQASLIHLATHGTANRLRPEYSHLVLAKPRQEGTGFDGLLDAHEIVRKVDARKARLVVLSACQTHVGPTNRGDEVQSLANAFLYAGAREVLASLWPVSDRSTAQLMQIFYSGLNRGLTPAAALQQAMQEMSRQGHHPYYWAGFQLIGDM